MDSMADDSDKTPRKVDEEQPQALRFEPYRLVRQIPRAGNVTFRPPAAAAEDALGPLYGEDVAARAFVNSLVAACVESPRVTADEIDGWSDRARATARVAVAEITGCSAPYKRLAGSGRDGDERLREAMRERRNEFAKRMRMTMAAFSSSTNVARLFDSSRLGAASVVEQMMQRQRGIERLMFSPSALDTVSKLSRSSLFPVQNERLQTGVLASFDIGRSPLFGQLEQLKKLGALTAFNTGRSPFSGSFDQLTKLTSFAMPRGSGGISDGAAAGRLAGLASPSYFGALHGIGRIPDTAKLFGGIGRIPDTAKLFGGIGRIPDTAKLFGGIGRIPDTAKPFGGIGRIPDTAKLFGGIGAQFSTQTLALQYDTMGRLFERVRDQASAPLRAYVAWVEREWAAAKAEHRPPPVLFVLASLPALIGLQLLEELQGDEEPLLASLEEELASGTFGAELQNAVQRNAVLDPVAKRHLAQAVDWIAAGCYVDAAPPLYQGLERAFRLTARLRGVVDAHGNFLVPGVRKSRMRKIEDTFRHLGFDHLYVRFLHAWVFGEIGNLARHGDLPEVEHRRWVLRAVVALVGWLEYAGGEADAVADLVERLELASASRTDAVA
jgi:hypothetical protein